MTPSGSKEVLYCDGPYPLPQAKEYKADLESGRVVCSFPPEYCEFGDSATKCREWLKDAYSELHERLYSEAALQEKMKSLSVEAQVSLEKATAKKEAKAEAKAESEHKKKMASKVVIKRIARTNRKHVTAIQGLEAFGVDLKKAAKSLAQRYATGASVSKNAAGQEEIVIQGDVGDDVAESDLFKDIPEDNVDFVDEKKKKKT